MVYGNLFVLHNFIGIFISENIFFPVFVLMSTFFLSVSRSKTVTYTEGYICRILSHPNPQLWIGKMMQSLTDLTDDLFIFIFYFGILSIITKSFISFGVSFRKILYVLAFATVCYHKSIKCLIDQSEAVHCRNNWWQ